MFGSIQESIRMLSTHVGESMNRVENTVNRVADDVRVLTTQVTDLRIKQDDHGKTLEELIQARREALAAERERTKTVISAVMKIATAVVCLGLASLAGAHGKEWLATLFRVLAGG